MSEVAVLHPCGGCGKAYGEAFDLAFGDEIIGQGRACDECMDKALARIDQVRPVFDAMITAGVAAEIASETMTFMLGRLDPPKHARTG